ncbi:hypothetical protein [Virgibacillus salexigens]|uniref:Uncharacterized protein n=1 Tax=Virgibacillus massiliensis TaxID=1462526 RepID=A0A024Q8W4_9BACI|nr:hypothetical protein [Virgibacillus massiliensis]CDQ38919.1 hypothetical protein BN990_01196 [Virgibacillus massiliensis]
MKTTEVRLIEKANKLQLQINYIVYPFVNAEHPAHRTLQDLMIEKANAGDYSLIESVNQKVAELTKERAEVMQELNNIREGKTT